MKITTYVCFTYIMYLFAITRCFFVMTHLISYTVFSALLVCDILTDYMFSENVLPISVGASILAVVTYNGYCSAYSIFPFRGSHEMRYLHYLVTIVIVIPVLTFSGIELCIPSYFIFWSLVACLLDVYGDMLTTVYVAQVTLQGLIVTTCLIISFMSVFIF